MDSCKDATRRGGGKIKIQFPAQGPFVLPEASCLRDRFFRSISEPSGDSAIRLDHPHPPGGGQCGSWSPPVSSLFLASPHNTPRPPPSPGVARRSCLERIVEPGANWLLPRCAPALAVRGEEPPLTEPLNCTRRGRAAGSSAASSAGRAGRRPDWAAGRGGGGSCSRMGDPSLRGNPRAPALQHLLSALLFPSPAGTPI